MRTIRVELQTPKRAVASMTLSNNNGSASVDASVATTQSFQIYNSTGNYWSADWVCDIEL